LNGTETEKVRPKRSANKTVRIQIPPDEKATPGGWATVLMTVESNYDASKTANNMAHVVINQYYSTRMAPGKWNETGEPGVQLQFSISVTNEGNGDDVVSMDAEVPDDWLASFGSYSSFDLEWEAIQVIRIHVTIPREEAAGDHKVVIKAISAGPEGDPSVSSITVNVTVEPVYMFGLAVSKNPDGPGPPGSDFNFTIDVRNLGNIKDNITMEVVGLLEGWEATFSPRSFLLPHKDIARTNLTVTAGTIDESPAGVHGIKVRASSEGAPYIEKEIVVTLMIEQVTVLDLSVRGGSGIEINPFEKESNDIILALRNDGNGIEDVTLKITDRGWDTTVGIKANILQTVVTVQRAEEEDIVLRVDVPQGTPFGTYNLTITATSRNDESTLDTLVVQLLVVQKDVRVTSIKFAKNYYTKYEDWQVYEYDEETVTIYVAVSIGNVGNVQIDEIVITLYLEGKKVNSKTIHNLATGKNATMSQQVTISESGIYEFEGKIEVAGDCDKTNDEKAVFVQFIEDEKDRGPSGVDGSSVVLLMVAVVISIILIITVIAIALSLAAKKKKDQVLDDSEKMERRFISEKRTPSRRRSSPPRERMKRRRPRRKRAKGLDFDEPEGAPDWSEEDEAPEIEGEFELIEDVEDEDEELIP
jgi:uncharacterized membrane protein